jgi:hypothetical protein
MTDSVISFRQRPYLSSVTTNVVPQAEAGTTGTTLNDADRQADITLSGGFLIATSGALGFNGVRSVASKGSGKFYFEAVYTTAATPAQNVIGIANSTHTLTDFVGASLNGCGWGGDGTVYINGADVGGATQGWAQGDTLCIAVDIDAELIWFRTNGGNWVNSGTANPATGTEGIDYSSANGGPFFVMVTLRASGDSATMKFNSASFLQTPPSGFGVWTP